MRTLLVLIALGSSTFALADAAVPEPGRGAPSIGRCGRMPPRAAGQIELRGELGAGTMICTADVPVSACGGDMAIDSRLGRVELELGTADVSLGCNSHHGGPLQCTLPEGTRVVVRGHFDHETNRITVDAICRA
jgi:hypothetical protein